MRTLLVFFVVLTTASGIAAGADRPPLGYRFASFQVAGGQPSIYVTPSLVDDAVRQGLKASGVPVNFSNGDAPGITADMHILYVPGLQGLVEVYGTIALRQLAPVKGKGVQEVSLCDDVVAGWHAGSTAEWGAQDVLGAVREGALGFAHRCLR